MWLMILFYNSINQKLPPKGVSGGEHINYIFRGRILYTFRAPMAILLFFRDPNSTLVYNDYSISSAVVCSL